MMRVPLRLPSQARSFNIEVDREGHGTHGNLRLA